MLDYNDLIANKPIKDFLTETLTEEGLLLIELLINKEDYLSEFVLAEKSGIYVNTVRKLLYKLYEHKIVSYSRKREKTRGWYIYSWRLHLKKLLLRVMKLKQEELIKLKSSLIPETSNQFFYCKNCDLKIDFAVAMENNFACPSCSIPMIVYSPEVVNKKILLDVKTIKDDVQGLQNLWLKAAERARPVVKPLPKPLKVRSKLAKKPIKKVVKPVVKPKPVRKVVKPAVKPKPIKKAKLVKKVTRPKPVKATAKPNKKKSLWDRIRGK